MSDNIIDRYTTTDNTIDLLSIVEWLCDRVCYYEKDFDFQRTSDTTDDEFFHAYAVYRNKCRGKHENIFLYIKNAIYTSNFITNFSRFTRPLVCLELETKIMNLLKDNNVCKNKYIKYYYERPLKKRSAAEETQLREIYLQQYNNDENKRQIINAFPSDVYLLLFNQEYLDGFNYGSRAFYVDKVRLRLDPSVPFSSYMITLGDAFMSDMRFFGFNFGNEFIFVAIDFTEDESIMTYPFGLYDLVFNKKSMSINKLSSYMKHALLNRKQRIKLMSEELLLTPPPTKSLKLPKSFKGGKEFRRIAREYPKLE